MSDKAYCLRIRTPEQVDMLRVMEKTCNLNVNNIVFCTKAFKSFKRHDLIAMIATEYDYFEFLYCLNIFGWIKPYCVGLSEMPFIDITLTDEELKKFMDVKRLTKKHEIFRNQSDIPNVENLEYKKDWPKQAKKFLKAKE